MKYLKDVIETGEVSRCEICGKFYKTYAIILDNNPLSISSFLEDEEKSDGTMRTICKKCRDKLESKTKIVSQN